MLPVDAESEPFGIKRFGKEDIEDSQYRDR